LSVLLRGSIDEKLRWIFNLYDINRDGKVTIDEFKLIVTSVYDLMGRYTDPLIDDSTCKTHAEAIFNVS
jgi:Ca2+-binding EF-hand superfamily protein